MKTLDRSALFAGIPDLKLLELAPLSYPPLARQTRVSGSVKLRVTVSEGGAVIEAIVLSGHPLLQQAALDAVRRWKFAPMNESKDFEIVCTFAFLDRSSELGVGETFVEGPLHLVVLSNAPRIETMESKVAAR
jgi:TonB family protein